MNDYQPTSRRPIADVFRKTAHGAVALCVRWHIHPDAVSYGSIAAAAAAAVLFWQSGHHFSFLLMAPAFCYLRLWLNMLDGMVAIAAHKASLHGEIVNEVPDRISDVLIFAGVAHSGWVWMPLGYWAAIAAVFTAYIGIFGQAVGAKRQFAGLMSKQWRMVALHIGAWAQWAATHKGPAAFESGPTVFDVTLIVIIAGCAQTVVVRLARIVAALKQGDRTRA
jgi:phosphatidylglycerophosphate synthase